MDKPVYSPDKPGRSPPPPGVRGSSPRNILTTIALKIALCRAKLGTFRTLLPLKNNCCHNGQPGATCSSYPKGHDSTGLPTTTDFCFSKRESWTPVFLPEENYAIFKAMVISMLRGRFPFPPVFPCSHSMWTLHLSWGVENSQVGIWKYQYFKWSTWLHSDGFGVSYFCTQYFKLSELERAYLQNST